MSEAIINALMHLFAIIESVKSEVVDSGQLIVKPYLKKQLNQELTGQYLKLFEDYVEFYRREATILEERLKNEAKNIAQVTTICQQLCNELLQNERVVVFIQLVELINTDGKVSKKENEFMLLVAMDLNIPQLESDEICSFISNPDINNISKNNLLLIDNKIAESSEEKAREKKMTGVDEFIHIYKEGLFGQIQILFIRSIHAYVLKYIGPLELYLEGSLISNQKTCILGSGSIIKGNKITPIYESEISYKFLFNPKQINLTLQGDEVEFRFKNSKNGIQPFSFQEVSGQMIGIMGGSGTGKSTLMNMLNGKLKPTSGQILINDHTIQRCVESGVIGYVPQDDLLFDELTVYENMYFNAQLSFCDFSKTRLDHMVHQVLDELDILDIKDLTVGDPLNKFISGGQRKRLNIALELLREPSVIYVDEPISGLSSMDSRVVMNLLKDISRRGKLVIAIIHQPSSDIFKLFDKLWILDKGGYLIYDGNPVDAVVYFKTMNTQVNAAESECRTCGNVIPEQILHIIEAKEINVDGTSTKRRKISAKKWYAKYKKHLAPAVVKVTTQGVLPPSNFLIPNRLQQSVIFFHRLLKSKRTNIQYLLLNAFEPPLLAFILGILAKYSIGETYLFSENKNIPIYLFMTVVVALFMGLSISAEEIFKDRKVLERESFLNLSRYSYINSKIAYLFLLSGLQMFLFAFFGNYLLEIKNLGFEYWLVLFSAACFANMLGLNISSGLNSIVTIYILIPLLLVPQLLLGGAMIKFNELHYKIGDKTHVPLIGNMMVSRWAYEALAVVQFKKNNYEKYFYKEDKIISSAGFNSAYLIPKIQSKLENIYAHLEAGNQSKALANEIELCRKELIKLQELKEVPPFYRLKNLTVEKFDSISHSQLRGKLDQIKQKFSNIKKQAIKSREIIYYKLIDEIGKDGLVKLKKDHYNASLNYLVKNREQIDKLVEINGQLVQTKDPIFLTPQSHYGNAHFYAPEKIIGNLHINTFLFNLLVIWLMTTFFYITLYFDLLRKLISYLTHLFRQY